MKFRVHYVLFKENGVGFLSPTAKVGFRSVEITAECPTAAWKNAETRVGRVVLGYKVHSICGVEPLTS